MKQKPKKKETLEKKEALHEKMKKARSIIVLSVTNSVLRKIRKEETATRIMRVLDQLYLAKSLPNRFYLKQKLYGYRMPESLSIESNIDEYLQLITDLENIDVMVSDEDQAILLLMSLPKQFDQLLRYGTGRTTLTLDEVVAAIYAKEFEIGSNSHSNKDSGESMYARERREHRGRPDCRDKSPRYNKSWSKSKRKKGCWICGEEGHFKNSYPSRNKSQGKSRHQASSSRGEATMVKDDSEATGLYVLEALHLTGISLEDEWVIDTGCSYHMTYRREWFEDLREDVGGSVRMGNKTTSKVRGIGNVRIRNEDGSTFLLTQVRFIPDMDRHLLSMGTLEKLGCGFESKNGLLKVTDGTGTLTTGKRHEKLYLLQGKPECGQLLVAEKRSDDTLLWHRRLGHMSQKNMDLMVKNGLLDRKKISTFGMCEDCEYGKAKRVSFAVATHDTKDRLDYIHSDLWGAPSVPTSLSKCQYFISFIDDYSRKT